MKDLGNKFLFVCSRSGYKMCHDKIEKSFEGTEDIRQYEIFGGVSSVGEIERMRKIVRENRPLEQLPVASDRDQLSYQPYTDRRTCYFRKIQRG